MVYIEHSSTSIFKISNKIKTFQLENIMQKGEKITKKTAPKTLTKS